METASINSYESMRHASLCLGLSKCSSRDGGLEFPLQDLTPPRGCQVLEETPVSVPWELCQKSLDGADWK